MNRVAEVLDSYLRALEAGNAPNREVLLARNTTIAGELAVALDGLDFVHRAGLNLAGPHGREEDAGPGRVLGDYRLVREIGRGGMAVVYEAEQISLGRQVALKVLPFAAVLDHKRIQRFKNEAMAAAHLRHPNIVPVYGVGCDRGVHYYAMQYVEGESLAVAIRELEGGGKREGSKTPISSHSSNQEPAYLRMAAKLGMKAAEALDHAHQMGIVHRDVKPGNLLVDAGGTLWLTDFGLAHSLKDVGLTMTGELLGTVRYMSPEQALAKRVPVDHRTDIYSLGATLYELFTLAPAFPGDDPRLVIQDIALHDPVQPRRLNPALPRDLETVVLKALEKDPTSRYTTAQEMADDLKRYLEDQPVHARRPSLAARMAKWSRRHRTLVGATVVLLLLSIAGLGTGTALLWREQAQTKLAFENAQANLGLALQALDQIYIDEAEGHPKIREGLPRDLLQKGLGFYEAFAEENARSKGLVFQMGNAFLSAGLIFRELGEEARAVESLKRALAAYDQALLIDSLDFGAQTNRGAALSGLGRFEEALTAYDKAQEINPRDSRIHNNRGYALRDLKRFEEALAAYDLALKIDPRDTIAHNNRGIALSDLRRFEEALAAYDQAIGIDPRNVQAHGNRGIVLANLKRFEESLAACDLALGIDPRSARAHGSRGHALEILGRFAESLAACDLAVELDPRSAGAHTNRGNALRGLGRLDEALAACDRALGIDPLSAAAHGNRALVLRSMGRFEEALAACERAIVINPQRSSYVVSRGTSLRDLKRLEEALAAYDLAVEIDSRNADAYVNRGALLCDFLGRPADALADFDRAIVLEPRHADAHHNRCLALRRLGRLEDALAELDLTIELGLQFARTHNVRGDTLRDLSRFEEALAAYNRVLEVDPLCPVDHISRGTVLCDNLGRPAEALAEFDLAIGLDPESAVAHADRGNALLSLGRVEESLAACDRAIKIDPRYALAHAIRGIALGELQRLDEALAELDLAVKFDPQYSQAHNTRGSLLRDLERLDDALAAYNRAIEIDARNSMAHYNRGNALRDKGEAEAAIEAFGETIRLRPDFAEAHCNLGLVLMGRQQFRDALPWLKQGHALGLKRADWTYPSADWVESAERQAEPENRLEQVLAGEREPRDALERIEFALLLDGKSRHAESARMSAEAFAEDVALAEDLSSHHRYNAACSASLQAARGEADAAEWRGRALEWLRADLAAREKAPSELVATLEHWKEDTDLACVRDRLADMVSDDREGWTKLWADVDALLARAREAK